MNFGQSFARALAPAAFLAAAVPSAAASDSADLAGLKAHIGGVQTMTADFVQTDARGRSAAGTLQLKRPGKVRFQYGSGDLLLVANGKTLTFLDYQVGQKSSWPLSRTPLGSVAVQLAGFQRQGPDPAERRLACGRRPCAQYVRNMDN